MDYKTLIDDETWEFIRTTESFYFDDAVAQTIAQQRQEYDRMCAFFFHGYPADIVIENTQWESIPVRIYTPKKSRATLVYFHGGGYVVGGLDSHDDICVELAKRVSIRVVSVGYRLAPEHMHPAQFNDAVTTMKYASNTLDGPLILAGDSAGGNLAAAASHHSRHMGIELAGQILIYPSLGTKMNVGSFRNHANAPMLTTKDMVYYRDIRCKSGFPTKDPTFAPLDDTDFASLPSTVIFTAQCDPLADDGANYAEALRSAGSKALCIEETGLVHGYIRARKSVKRAQQSFERIVEATSALTQGHWPIDFSVEDVKNNI